MTCVNQWRVSTVTLKAGRCGKWRGIQQALSSPGFSFKAHFSYSTRLDDLESGRTSNAALFDHDAELDLRATGVENGLKCSRTCTDRLRIMIYDISGRVEEGIYGFWRVNIEFHW